MTDVKLVYFHTCTTQVPIDNIVMWETRLSIVDWVYSKTQIAGDLQGSKSTSVRILSIFGCRTFVSTSWMCKKQTSVSHSSADSEIISMDAGLRMDGLLARDLWDVVIEVSRSSNSAKPPTNPAVGNCSRNHESNPKQKGDETRVKSCA